MQLYHHKVLILESGLTLIVEDTIGRPFYLLVPLTFYIFTFLICLYYRYMQFVIQENMTPHCTVLK